MESMTGYATVEKTSDQFSFSISIKSLNSKYLEIYSNLPKMFKDEGVEIESLLRRKFERGKIEISIEFYDWADTRKLNINMDALRRYHRELSGVAKTLGLADGVSLEMLLGMDGVVVRERTVLSDRTKSDIFKTLDDVIERAIRMRRKEGASIRKDLKSSVSVISGNLAQIRKLSKNTSQDIFEKIRKNIEAIAGKAVVEDRLYTEVAILADRMDVNEEIIRLSDHIKKFNAVMEEDGQIGKRLDFIAQEMFREINTMASKSGSSSVSHLVVDMKNHIDKIREQCRNVV